MKNRFSLSTIQTTWGRTEKTTLNQDFPPKRTFTFKYYFNIKGHRVQVCKSYFLSTLQISQKPVYNAHSKKNTGVPENLKNDVRNHITSFTVIESHYCRADMKKKYLEKSLRIKKCSNFSRKTLEPSRKREYVQKHFLTEFNLDFHVPTKDRCDLCEEREVAVKENIPFSEEKCRAHIEAKTAMRAQRDNDRKGYVPVLSFDLQNIISCPRAEIGC